VLSDSRLLAADALYFLADRDPIAALIDFKEKLTWQLRWYIRFERLPVAIFARKRKAVEPDTFI
jgi:predicted dithiol-disulfide oxidoreductase (DUF899 family)